MRNKAMRALMEMEMPDHLAGFTYIADAMELMDRDDYSAMKCLYVDIASKNGAKPSTVERAIRHAFGVVLTKGNSMMVDHYLSRNNPSNGHLLHLLYSRLTREG